MNEFLSRLSNFEQASADDKTNRVIEIATFAQQMPESASEVSEAVKSQNQAKLQALITSIEIIKSLEIAGFNFSDVPLMNVAPPEHSGIDAGGDPAAIKDPTLRAQYEAALAANKRKAIAFKNQVVLREKKESLINSIKVFLYNHSESKDSYLSIINNSKVAEDLKEALQNNR